MTALQAVAGLCPRCGMKGAHRDAMQCIDALRDHIAVLEWRKDDSSRGESGRCALRTPAPPRGGRVPRSDNRWVVLDGQRMILTDAARQLGISNVALHFRLVNRTGTTDYSGTDVRAVGADRKHTQIEASRLAHAAKARIHAAD